METYEKIKQERKRKNITQKQLGDLIGITWQGIAQWENGLREPKLISILKISRALKINPMQLLPDWFIEEVNKYATP